MTKSLRSIPTLTFVLALAACAESQGPVAPLAPGSNTASASDNAPDFVGVCLAMQDGSYRRVDLPANAADIRVAQGVELAGGPKLDANCERYQPRIFRDDFDGPLGPNWSFHNISRSVEEGVLRISGQGIVGFRHYMYAPFPASRIEWEIGWRSAGSAGLLTRTGGVCSIICNYDVHEEFFAEAVGARYHWSASSPYGYQGWQLTAGEHVARIVWDRVGGRATIIVDGVPRTDFPTVARFVRDPGVLDFFLSGSFNLTHIEYAVYPEF